MSSTRGASSGLLDQDDVALVASEIEPGGAAATIVYENRVTGRPHRRGVRRRDDEDPRVEPLVDVTSAPEATTKPDPGSDLISRAVGGADRAWFYASGRDSVRDLERILGTVGRTLHSFASILDFGCGCGRMLLWMDAVGRDRALYGTDVDAEAVGWCQEHVPYAAVSVNGADPPLAYPDGTFDLVYSHSVFTHLDEPRQDAWLGELQRVTKPAGFVVASTQGEAGLGEDPWGVRERLDHEGIVFIDDVFGPTYPLPAWYQRTFHARWYVLEHWSRWFDVRAHVPGGALGAHDQILLERPGTPMRSLRRSPQATRRRPGA